MTVPVTTIVGAEVEGARVDVRLEGERVAAVGPGLVARGTEVVQADGGALLPGLHDHHIHLLAMAAVAGSLDLGRAQPAHPATFDREIRAAHRRAPDGAWLRVVGLDERHGSVDRQRLDRLAPARPVRVQHRSGAAWVVSSAALDALGLADDDRAGVARDGQGAPTGWLHRLDDLVAERLPRRDPPDLAAVAARLAGYGVTGVTDATPYSDGGGPAALAAARRSGELPQRVVVTGGPELAGVEPDAALEVGPVKVIVADNAPPDVDALVVAFRAARGAGRPVAVHCVSRVALVLALAAWDQVPPVDGDRVEHGAVLPVELLDRIRGLGLRVVTQPAFIADRGDRYREEVEPDDRSHLYRCGSLLAAGIPVAGSTDAPFGPSDPWEAMAAAIDRRTASGAVLGADEAISPRRALGLFLSPADKPGSGERQIVPGARADLCLLSEPLATVLEAPAASSVRECWIGGQAASELVASGRSQVRGSEG